MLPRCSAYCCAAIVQLVSCNGAELHVLCVVIVLGICVLPQGSVFFCSATVQHCFFFVLLVRRSAAYFLCCHRAACFYAAALRHGIWCCHSAVFFVLLPIFVLPLCCVFFELTQGSVLFVLPQCSECFVLLQCCFSFFLSFFGCYSATTIGTKWCHGPIGSPIPQVQVGVRLGCTPSPLGDRYPELGCNRDTP